MSPQPVIEPRHLKDYSFLLNKDLDYEECIDPLTPFPLSFCDMIFDAPESEDEEGDGEGDDGEGEAGEGEGDAAEAAE